MPQGARPLASLPEFRTPRLTLRAFSIDDAVAVKRLAGDRAIADTTLNVPHPYRPGMAEDWIATHAPGFTARELAVFAVTLTADAALIGAVSLDIEMRFRRANLGYWIGKPYWNRGYCTEAAAALIDFGFSTLGLNRVHAAHFRRNPASGRVIEKLGMTREGLQREHMRKWGRYEDSVIYGLLRRDWRAAGAPDPGRPVPVRV